MGSVFSEESQLYIRELELIHEMDRIWRNDVDEFFKSLREALADIAGGVLESRSRGYRYWSCRDWALPSNATLHLWCEDYPVAILRDKLLGWDLYGNLAQERRVQANHLMVDRAGSGFDPPLVGARLTRGSQPGAYRALRLEIDWRADPVTDCAALMRDALARISDVWTGVRKILEQSPAVGGEAPPPPVGAAS